VLKPATFKVKVADGQTRYGFALERVHRTRRFLATLDVLDRRWDSYRNRGFKLDVRLFG